MNKKLFFISLLIFCFSKNGLANYEYDKNLERAYDLILTFHLNEAQQLLQKEKLEKPDNDLRLLYLNYIDFLKAFVSEEKSEFENLKRNTSLRLKELNRRSENSNSPFHLYVQSEILIQQALVRIKFNELINSAGEIRRAYKLIQKNKTLYPAFILNAKISGLLNTMIGTVPSKYQWIIRYAGMEGNVLSGQKELEELMINIATTNYKSYRPEILFYLGNLYTVFSIPVDTSNLIKQIYPFTSEYPLLAFIYSNIMSKIGKNDESLAVLNASIQNETTYPFVFLYYKRGLARLRKLDLSSKSDFEYYLKNYKGQNNIKSTYQKLAWVEFIKGSTSEYSGYLKLCRENGITTNEDDKSANEEAFSGSQPNVYLLRSRLFFDGGYYSSSLAEIAGNKIENFPRYRDQLEVTYRLGRIMQMTGQFEKAIDYFESTIKNGLSSEYYYAANSALMLGLIYEERKEAELAKKYFEQCLEIKHKEYSNSINQKALAGLERLKQKKTD